MKTDGAPLDLTESNGVTQDQENIYVDGNLVANLNFLRFGGSYDTGGTAVYEFDFLPNTDHTSAERVLQNMSVQSPNPGEWDAVVELRNPSDEVVSQDSVEIIRNVALGVTLDQVTDTFSGLALHLGDNINLATLDPQIDWSDRVIELTLPSGSAGDSLYIDWGAVPGISQNGTSGPYNIIIAYDDGSGPVNIGVVVMDPNIVDSESTLRIKLWDGASQEAVQALLDSIAFDSDADLSEAAKSPPLDVSFKMGLGNAQGIWNEEVSRDMHVRFAENFSPASDVISAIVGNKDPIFPFVDASLIDYAKYKGMEVSITATEGILSLEEGGLITVDGDPTSENGATIKYGDLNLGGLTVTTNADGDSVLTIEFWKGANFWKSGEGYANDAHDRALAAIERIALSTKSAVIDPAATLQIEIDDKDGNLLERDVVALDLNAFAKFSMPASLQVAETGEGAIPILASPSFEFEMLADSVKYFERVIEVSLNNASEFDSLTLLDGEPDGFSLGAHNEADNSYVLNYGGQGFGKAFLTQDAEGNDKIVVVLWNGASEESIEAMLRHIGYEYTDPSSTAHAAGHAPSLFLNMGVGDSSGVSDSEASLIKPIVFRDLLNSTKDVLVLAEGTDPTMIDVRMNLVDIDKDAGNSYSGWTVEVTSENGTGDIVVSDLLGLKVYIKHSASDFELAPNGVQNDGQTYHLGSDADNRFAKVEATDDGIKISFWNKTSHQEAQRAMRSLAFVPEGAPGDISDTLTYTVKDGDKLLDETSIDIGTPVDTTIVVNPMQFEPFFPDFEVSGSTSGLGWGDVIDLKIENIAAWSEFSEDDPYKYHVLQIVENDGITVSDDNKLEYNGEKFGHILEAEEGHGWRFVLYNKATDEAIEALMHNVNYSLVSPYPASEGGVGDLVVTIGKVSHDGPIQVTDSFEDVYYDELFSLVLPEEEE